MATVTLNYSIDNKNNKLLNFLKKHADEMAKEINSVMAHDQYNRAKEIIQEAVDTWYGAYSPHAYRRTYSLYNAYDVGIRDDQDFIFEIDPGMMGYHHQDNEYVYEVTAVEGMHGGPIWRTPIPFFTDPLCGAVTSYPIESMIMEKWTAYLNGEYKFKQQAVINSVARKYAAMVR